MEAIDFIRNYQKFLDELQLIVKPESFESIEKLREIDPRLIFLICQKVNKI